MHLHIWYPSCRASSIPRSLFSVLFIVLMFCNFTLNSVYQYTHSELAIYILERQVSSICLVSDSGNSCGGQRRCVGYCRKSWHRVQILSFIPINNLLSAMVILPVPFFKFKFRQKEILLHFLKSSFVMPFGGDEVKKCPPELSDISPPFYRREGTHFSHFVSFLSTSKQ